MINFSFVNIGVNPSISTIGTIHLRNTHLVTAKIKLALNRWNFIICENSTTWWYMPKFASTRINPRKNESNKNLISRKLINLLTVLHASLVNPRQFYFVILTNCAFFALHVFRIKYGATVIKHYVKHIGRVKPFFTNRGVGMSKRG